MAFVDNGKALFYINGDLMATHNADIPTVEFNPESANRFDCRTYNVDAVTGELEIQIAELKLWGRFPNSLFSRFPF